MLFNRPPNNPGKKFDLIGFKSYGLAWFCVLFIFTGGGPNVYAKSIEAQRKDYVAARNAVNKNQFKRFAEIANTLTDYPLYPYLRYAYLRKKLRQAKDEEMIDFFKRHDDLPVANNLRTAWLKLLIQRRHWQTFIDHYTPQTDKTMQCHQLAARMKIGHTDFLLEDIRTAWLAGESLPTRCDPAFALLYKSDLMSNELVWERIRLAMQNHNLNLVNYLLKKLNGEHRLRAEQWIRIHHNPYKHTKNPALEDTPVGREILVHGVLRLAKQNISRAVERLNALKNTYSFTSGEIAEIERTLAVRAAKNKSKLAAQLLDEIDNYHVDDQVFHYRLRTALAEQDWVLLKKWTTGEPAMADIKLRWRYWYARALEETGEPDKAHKLYAELAAERDYYGFLAADKINASYRMNHYPLPENKQEFIRIQTLPAIRRAYEFYKLNMGYQARREWHNALNKMTTYQMQMAAAVAKQWGWHDRAIFTMSRAKAYDDLLLRFPILFRDLLDKYAKKRKLDPGWIYGLVRAESAFIEDAKSPAGALGLMQVMPKTGKMTAKRIGLKEFKTDKLKQADTNIPIGSAYMQMMLEKFNGNMVLATAAYNAGPHRVLKWLPKSGCVEPDVWIEQIPFNETRKYVRRVLYYASIYDWRLQTGIKPVKERMALIRSSNKSPAANADCMPMKISDSRHVN